MNIQYSAPVGISIGGLGVTYGKPCITIATGLTVKGKVVNFVDRPGQNEEELMKEKISAYLIRLTRFKNKKKLTVAITVDNPEAKSLPGYLAAMVVVAVAGFLHGYGENEATPDVVNRTAYEIMKKCKKEMVGSETSSSVFGGVIYYRREFEFLKTVSQLNVRLPQAIAGALWLVRTQRHPDCSSQTIRHGMMHNLQKTRLVLDNIERQIKRIIISMTKEDTIFFLKAMRNLGGIYWRQPLNKNLATLSLGNGWELLYSRDEPQAQAYTSSGCGTLFCFTQAKVGLQRQA
ncbi:hypothetical protein HY214_00735 [Candidatus Roizmanbacteria bacterium]|nr:hypothetical protein [Candidatus Roizmanbacteria bacterium]